MTRLALALATDAARLVVTAATAPARLITPRACRGHWCRACGWPL